MRLSIVVTTYNREQVLAELLRHLSHQSDPDFEVVVAIDGSTDGTEAMLQALSTPYPLSWVNTHCTGYGLAVARNLGILAATGDLVVIIDDDCFPCPDFVAAHKRSAKRKTITGGPRTPGSPDDQAQIRKMSELRRLPSSEPMSFEKLHATWPAAVATECNICLFRQDLVDLGLFSERLKLYGFIGQEFFARAKHFGYAYQFNADAEIVHRRQDDGDNSLSLRRKRREVMVSSALNPYFMTAAQYGIQADWARRAAERYPETCPLPPFPKGAIVAFPYRFIRGRLRTLRHWIRRRAAAR